MTTIIFVTISLLVLGGLAAKTAYDHYKEEKHQSEWTRRRASGYTGMPSGANQFRR